MPIVSCALRRNPLRCGSAAPDHERSVAELACLGSGQADLIRASRGNCGITLGDMLTTWLASARSASNGELRRVRA